MHLISVDLPAPLSPSSASTSPRCTLEVDVVEREHRAEALGGAAHGERRRGRGAIMRGPPAARGTALEPAADDVQLDGEHDDHADDDRLQERVDVEQVHAVADHADHQRADQRVGRRCRGRRGSWRRR